MKKVLMLILITTLIITGCNLKKEESKVNDKNNETVNEAKKNETKEDVKEEIKDDNAIGPIPLKVGKTKNITGAQLVKINDYELSIPDKLVKIGYSINVENNILTILSNDNKYKFIMYQLTDNYIMPTESEILSNNNFESYLNGDITYEEYEKLNIQYFKKLGYNEKNSPDYTLLDSELEVFRRSYLSGESTGSGCSEIFPGDKCYENYDWGEHIIYKIPKTYTTEMFGTNTSDFSAYIEIFEYYENNNNDYDIDLWTL